MYRVFLFGHLYPVSFLENKWLEWDQIMLILSELIDQLSDSDGTAFQKAKQSRDVCILAIYVLIPPNR